MSEANVVRQTENPNTVATLRRDFEQLGVRPGSVIIMHSALSKLGWTAGGPVAVIQALLDALTPDGTLVMPTHSSDNSEPSRWRNPPVPESWWPLIRAEMPAFQPELTPTREMGVIAETFRGWPGVARSNHPRASFATWGKHAEFVTANHTLESSMGEQSPLARVYDLDGQVLLLGVTHGNNTSLHLAEHRSDYPGKRDQLESAACLVDGKREWVTWRELAYTSDDFERCGAAYEYSIGYTPGRVGQAEARLVSQRAVVDFAVTWFEAERRLAVE